MTTAIIPPTVIDLNKEQKLNETNSFLFDIINTKNEGIYKIISSDFKYLTFNVENTKANYTFHLKPSSFDENVKKLSMEHNLSYFKEMSRLIYDELEHPEKLASVRESIINCIQSKPNEYLNQEDIHGLAYKTFRYRYSQTSNEKMYCNIYSTTRNDLDARDTALKVFNNSTPLYFNNVEEFFDYVKNKSISYEEIVYFDLYLNIFEKVFYYVPNVHSINFNKEPSMDNSIKGFNEYSKEEQMSVVKEMISNSLLNNDFKDMKQPSFYFKPMYFKMDDINMKDLLEFTQNGIRYKPSLWGGRSSNMSMENAKETFNMYGNDDLVLFLNNIKDCLMEHKDEFKEKLLEMKKVKKY